MTGILETVLTSRYGQPGLIPSSPFSEKRWNDEKRMNICVLYAGLKWDRRLERDWGALKPLYGDVFGGLLLGVPSCLKVAMLGQSTVFGLYRIRDLQARPDISRASSFDPDVCYFMAAANVWFYGVKQDRLFAYDSETDEFDSLGEIEAALHTVLRSWEYPSD